MKNKKNKLIKKLIFGNNTFNNDDGDIVTIKLRVDSNASSGTRTITLRDIILSSPSTPVPYVSQPSMGNITISAPSVLPGDADRNGKVDINDVNKIIDYCLGVTTTIDSAADANGDKKVTIADAVKIIQSFKE